MSSLKHTNWSIQNLQNPKYKISNDVYLEFRYHEIVTKFKHLFEGEQISIDMSQYSSTDLYMITYGKIFK